MTMGLLSWRFKTRRSLSIMIVLWFDGAYMLLERSVIVYNEPNKEQTRWNSSNPAVYENIIYFVFDRNTIEYFWNNISPFICTAWTSLKYTYHRMLIFHLFFLSWSRSFVFTFAFTFFEDWNLIIIFFIRLNVGDSRWATRFISHWDCSRSLSFVS